MEPGRIQVERIRITRVGVGYLAVLLMIVVAAVNSGNNALFLVVAAMLALFAVSGFASRRNLRRLELELGRPSEVYASRPFSLPIRVANRDRWMARRFLEIGGLKEADPVVLPHVRRGQSRSDRLFFRIERRGRHQFAKLRVSSLFPFGFFQKALLYPIGLEILAYPRLLSTLPGRYFELGRAGEEPSIKIGRGHELYALRHFRLGDDPRGIHWKRTARTGEMVFMEREKEEGRRLSVVLDNAVGELRTAAQEQAFERAVSEAATAVAHYLSEGFEVALTTRQDRIPFSRGEPHRRRMLEALAVVSAQPIETRRLTGPAGRSPVLQLGWTDEAQQSAPQTARRAV